MSAQLRGTVYVVGDNIDTDQIIPAKFLSLVPTIEDEYRQLGSHALCGLPLDDYPTRLTDGQNVPSPYKVIIAGRNFGCGSSREHAPIALGAAGIVAVVAESFARIFFRNCVATGELYPIECKNRLCRTLTTGDEIDIDLDAAQLRGAALACHEALQPLGEVRKVIAAGGLFAYARQQGLLASREVTP